jgi:hypothetical protein
MEEINALVLTGVSQPALAGFETRRRCTGYTQMHEAIKAAIQAGRVGSK